MSRWTRILLIIYISLTFFLLLIGLPIIRPSLSYRLNAEEREYLNNIEVIYAVGDRSFPPFSFLSVSGPTGYERELVIELQRVLGVPIHHSQIEWTEARKRLESGQADFVTGMSVTPERELLYRFSDPILLSTYALIVPAHSPLRNYEDIRSTHLVVAQTGSITYEIAEKAGFNLLGVSSPEVALETLRKGEADAWIENQWVSRHLLSQREPYGWRLIHLDGVSSPYGLALNAEADDVLLRVLNKAIKRLSHEGTLKQIQARWFGPAVQNVSDMEGQHRRFMFLLVMVVFGGGGILVYNVQLHRQVTQKTSELIHTNKLLSEQQGRLRELLVSTARALGTAIEVKDKYTGGHSQRVARASVALARRMGFDSSDSFHVYLGALMHDIGKVGVPDFTLTKKDRLTEEELAQIRQHPEIGDSILRNVDGFHHIREIVLHHHERWDGNTSGTFPAYPGMCSGADIPLGARIVAVADAYDAMTSDRPYKEARSVAEALQELRDCAGKQFDPDVVAAMCSIESELQNMRQSIKTPPSPGIEPVPEEL